MSNPAFIVDGYTEKHIIERICPGQPVKRTDLNGKSVKIEAIAKRVATLARLLGGKYYPIIVLVDKEDRNISFENMAQQILKAVQKEGLKGHDIRVGVADRMIENWILADWQQLTGSPENKPPVTDGLNGASQIKKIKNTYDKIIDGVELFLHSNPDTIYQNSSSFRYFANQLDSLNCEFIKKICFK